MNSKSTASGLISDLSSVRLTTRAEDTSGDLLGLWWTKCNYRWCRSVGPNTATVTAAVGVTLLSPGGFVFHSTVDHRENRHTNHHTTTDGNTWSTTQQPKNHIPKNIAQSKRNLFNGQHQPYPAATSPCRTLLQRLTLPDTASTNKRVTAGLHYNLLPSL